MTKRKYIERVLELADWYHCGQIGFDHYVEGLANLLVKYELEVEANVKAKSNNN